MLNRFNDKWSMITLNLLERMTKCSKNRTIVCIRGIQRRGHDWEQEPFLRSNLQYLISENRETLQVFQFPKVN